MASTAVIIPSGPPGTLSVIGTAPNVYGAVSMAISPDSTSVYTANQTNVSQYNRNIVNGNLTQLSPFTISTVTSFPYEIIVSPDNLNVYVTIQNSGYIAQFSRNTSTGQLTALSTFTVNAGVYPRGIAISADGLYVYVANQSDYISQFSRNTSTGQLTPLSPATVATTGTGSALSGIAVSPDGTSVYVVDGVNSVLALFSRNTSTGLLTQLSPGTSIIGYNPRTVYFSPDSLYVYAVSYGLSYISQFSRNTSTGQLTPLSPATVNTYGTSQGGNNPVKMVISPNGLSAYTANYTTSSGANSISQFSRDNITGKLTLLTPPTVTGSTDQSGIVISSDNMSVYTSSDDTLIVNQYKRN